MATIYRFCGLVSKMGGQEIGEGGRSHREEQEREFEGERTEEEEEEMARVALCTLFGLPLAEKPLRSARDRRRPSSVHAAPTPTLRPTYAVFGLWLAEKPTLRFLVGRKDLFGQPQTDGMLLLKYTRSVCQFSNLLKIQCHF
jgi:hypothetical protein